MKREISRLARFGASRQALGTVVRSIYSPRCYADVNDLGVLIAAGRLIAPSAGIAARTLSFD